MINYKHLQYFHVVAMCGSVAAASERLHVTSQAISTQLQVLEQRMGNELFRKKGRQLELTEAGKTVMLFSEQIFSLGNELEQTVRQGLVTMPKTLRIGMCDVVPKTLSFRLLQAVRDACDDIRLVCREGNFHTMMAELSAHRLDVVVADRSIPPDGAIRGYSHLLGSSALTVLGHPDLCRIWQGTFPQRLQGAPFLLPGTGANLYSQLQAWFKSYALRPAVVGEFDDSALMKSFARSGAGFIAVPEVLAAEIVAEYGLERVGMIDSVVEQFHAVTVERRMDHPAVHRILEQAAAVFEPELTTSLHVA